MATQCKRLLYRLEQQNLEDKDETILQLKRILGEGQRASWKGPFAWSLLVTISRTLSLISETVAPLVWTACEMLQFYESNLTLKPLDFDKMLCNLANRFLECNIWGWSCTIASLLRQRLQEQGGSLRLSFGKIALGNSFIVNAPLIEILKCEQEELVALVWNCQLVWLRLAIVRHSTWTNPICLLEQYLFATGGVIETLLLSDSNTKERLMTFFHYWRRLMALLVSTDYCKETILLEMKLQDCLIKKMTGLNLTSSEFDLLRAKNFVFYCANCWNPKVLKLFDIDWVKLVNAQEVLPLFESLPQDKLESIMKTSSVNFNNQLVLWFLLLIQNEEERDIPILSDKIECSGSFELWFYHKAGKTLLQRPVVAKMILIILNRLVYIRHNQALSLYYTCIKQVATPQHQKDHSLLLLTAFKRICKLALHFKQLTKVMTSLLSVIKAILVQEQVELAVQLFNILISTLPMDMWNPSTVLETISPNKNGDLDFLLADIWISLAKRVSEKNPAIQFPILIDKLIERVLELLSSKMPFIDVLAIWHHVVDRIDPLNEAIIDACLMAIGSSHYPPVSASFWESIIEKRIFKISPFIGQFLKILSLYVQKKDIDNELAKLKSSKDETSISLKKKVVEIALPFLILQGCHNIVSMWNTDNFVEFEDLYLHVLLITEKYPQAESFAIEKNILAVYQTLQGSIHATIVKDSSIYTSMQHYLNGNLKEAFETGKFVFESILQTLGGNSISFGKVLLLKVELMRCIEWLLYICKVMGSYRQTRYFLKAGITYAESIRSTWWQQEFSKIENNLFASGENCINFVSKSFIQTIFDYVPWIEYRLNQIAHITEERPLSIFLTDLKARKEEITIPLIVQDVFKWGTPHQLRKIICHELLKTSNPLLMERMIHMVWVREMVDFNKLEKGSGLVNSTLFFLDPHNNLIYVLTDKCYFVEGVTVLRIRLIPRFEEMDHEFQSIIRGNEEMLFNNKMELNGMDKRKWWEQRYALEKRLKLVVTMLDGWLRPIKAFLPLFNHSNSREKPNSNYHDEFREQSNPSHSTIIKSLALPKLAAALAKIDSVDSVDLILKALNINDETTDQGLRNAIQLCKRDQEHEDPFKILVEDTPNRLLLFIVDPLLHHFPWECCPIFSDYIMVRTAWTANTILFDEHLKIYTLASIINPSGDLKRTEDTLRPLMGSVNPDLLILGIAPIKDQMQSSLTTDLVIYCGHGSGESYLNSQPPPNNCASLMLFGCSSGRLKRNCYGFNLDGALLKFIQAESPFILANLWDVTDRDIDQLTMAFLEPLNLGDRPRILTIERLAESLKVARQVCTLKFLNGAAPVIYFQSHQSLINK